MAQLLISHKFYSGLRSHMKLHTSQLHVFCSHIIFKLNLLNFLKWIFVVNNCFFSAVWQKNWSQITASDIAANRTVYWNITLPGNRKILKTSVPNDKNPVPLITLCTMRIGRTNFTILFTFDDCKLKQDIVFKDDIQVTIWCYLTSPRPVTVWYSFLYLCDWSWNRNTCTSIYMDW